jgi:hypothetical protein
MLGHSQPSSVSKIQANSDWIARRCYYTERDLHFAAACGQEEAMGLLLGGTRGVRVR